MEGSTKQIGQFSYDQDSVPLGAGTFGKVFKGVDTKNNNEPVAIKIIPAEVLKQYQDFIDLFLREINILREIRGEYILEFKKVLRTSSGNIYIVTNFCNGGNLEGLLKKQKKLSEYEALRILRQVTEAFIGIEKLDLRNEEKQKVIVMHRDLKPANILFHDGNVRIADFGFAKTVEDNAKDVKDFHTMLGTPLYMAPQILAEKEYSYKCDIWSMGVVVYELLFGVVPYNAATKFKLLEKIVKNRIQDFPPEVPLSGETQDLIKKMLEVDDAKRIDWKQINEHPAIVNNRKQEKALKEAQELAKKTEVEKKQAEPIEEKKVSK